MATFVEHFVTNVASGGIDLNNAGGPRWAADLGPTFAFTGTIVVTRFLYYDDPDDPAKDIYKHKLTLPEGQKFTDVSTGDRLAIRKGAAWLFTEVDYQISAIVDDQETEFRTIVVPDLGETYTGPLDELRAGGVTHVPSATAFDTFLDRISKAILLSTSRTRPWRVNVHRSGTNYTFATAATSLNATRANPLTIQGYLTVPGDLVNSESRPIIYKSGGNNLLTYSTPDTVMRFVDIDFELANPAVGPIDVLIFEKDGYTLDRCKITLTGTTGTPNITMIKCVAPVQTIRNSWIERPIGNADSISILVSPAAASKRGAIIVGNLFTRTGTDPSPTTGAAIRLLGGLNHVIENNLAIGDVYFLRSEKGTLNSTPTFRAIGNTIVQPQKGAIYLDWPAGATVYQDLVVQGNIFSDVTAEAVIQATVTSGSAAWGFIGYNVFYPLASVPLNAQVLDIRVGDQLVSTSPLAGPGAQDYRNTTTIAGTGLLHYLARIGGRVDGSTRFLNQLSPGAVNRQTT